MATGMFVHGFNLHEPEWERIVWGEPPYSMGRVPQAVYLLHMHYPQAKNVLFGSGASEKDGVKEGAYILNQLLGEFDRLRQFPVFSSMSPDELGALRNRIEKIAEPEVASHNTFTELEFGIPKLYCQGCFRIVLVTEKTHISRCMAHGFEILEKGSWMRGVSLIGEHSTVIPHNVRASEVVVFEPRGNGENAIVPNLKRIFRIPGANREAFNDALGELLEKVDA